MPSGSLDDAIRLCKVSILFINDMVSIRTAGSPAVHLTMYDEVSIGILQFSFFFNNFVLLHWYLAVNFIFQ